MRGLTFDELQELLKYVEEHHSWKNMYENHHNLKEGEPYPKLIKYVDFNMDTRDCTIWSVRFYNIAGVS